MPEFLDELDIRLIGYIHGRAIWKLNSDLRFKLNDRITIIVPKGFETDLASVPRIPLVFMLWGDRVHREAVLHDYLYRKDSLSFVTRACADNIFKIAMKRKNPFYVYEPIYWGVRLGARRCFQKLNVGYHFSRDCRFVSAC